MSQDQGPEPVQIYNLRGEFLSEMVRNRFGGAALYEARLTSANFRGADLRKGYFGRADLVGADFTNAQLNGADFDGADLTGANLTNATLRNAYLKGTRLRGANLSRADLSEANVGGVSFQGATMEGAVLTNAVLQGGSFLACPTLADAVGLETVRHFSPSYLDAITLRACINRLPDIFLQGVGYTPNEVAYLRDLYAQPIQFYSCFLSHGKPNAAFTERLRTDLISEGISTWHYRYDLKPGDYMATQIRDAIRLKDRLLLVCSKDALTRQPVIDEVVEALAHEDQSKERKLFPIRLDRFIFSEELSNLHREKVDKGAWRPWLDRVRAYWIADFTKWKDHDAYQVQFQTLIKALKEPGRPQ